MLGWLTNEGKEGGLLSCFPADLNLTVTDVKLKLTVFLRDAKVLRAEKASRVPGASPVIQQVAPQQQPLREQVLTMAKGGKQTVVIIDDPAQAMQEDVDIADLLREQQQEAPAAVQVDQA